jgi:hypothetical protein
VTLLLKEARRSEAKNPVVYPKRRDFKKRKRKKNEEVMKVMESGDGSSRVIVITYPGMIAQITVAPRAHHWLRVRALTQRKSKTFTTPKRTA